MRDLVKRLHQAIKDFPLINPENGHPKELFKRAADRIERLEAGEKAADAAITKYQRDLEIQKSFNEDFNRRVGELLKMVEKHGTG